MDPMDLDDVLAAFREALALTDCEGWPMIVAHVRGLHEEHDVAWRGASGTERTEMAAADKALAAVLGLPRCAMQDLVNLLRAGGDLFEYKGQLPQWDADAARIVVPEGFLSAMEALCAQNEEA